MENLKVIYLQATDHI